MNNEDRHPAVRCPALWAGVAVVMVAATLSAQDMANAQARTPTSSETANELERIRPPATPNDAPDPTALAGDSALDKRPTPLPLTVLDLIAITAVGLGIGAASLALSRSARRRRAAPSRAPLEPAPIAGVERLASNRLRADDDRRRAPRSTRSRRSPVTARRGPARPHERSRSRPRPRE
jgi:hypothetical protein